MKPAHRSLLVILLGLALTTCSGGGDEVTDTDVTADTEVEAPVVETSNGLVVIGSSSDGLVTVEATEGSSAAAIAVTVERINPLGVDVDDPHFRGTAPLAAYEIGPDGHQFDQPVTLTFSLDSSEFNLAEGEIPLIALGGSSDGAPFESLDSVAITVDDEQVMILGETDHFSRYSAVYRGLELKTDGLESTRLAIGETLSFTASIVEDQPDASAGLSFELHLVVDLALESGGAVLLDQEGTISITCLQSGILYYGVETKTEHSGGIDVAGTYRFIACGDAYPGFEEASRNSRIDEWLATGGFGREDFASIESVLSPPPAHPDEFPLGMSPDRLIETTDGIIAVGDTGTVTLIKTDGTTVTSELPPGADVLDWDEDEDCLAYGTDGATGGALSCQSFTSGPDPVPKYSHVVCEPGATEKDVASFAACEPSSTVSFPGTPTFIATGGGRLEIVEDDGSITDCWRARLEGEAKRPAMLFDIDGVSYDAVTRMVTIRGVDNSRRTHMTYEFLLNDGNRCNVLGGPDEGLPVVPGTVEAAGSEWTIDSDFNQSDPAAGGDLTITGYNDDGTPLEETFTIMTGKPLVGPPVLAGDDEYLFVAVDDVDFLMRTNAESGELDFVYVGDPPQVQYTVGGTRLFRIDRDTGEVDELSTLIAGQEGGLESVTAMTFDEQDRLVIADGGANAVYTYDPESDLIPLVG